MLGARFVALARLATVGLALIVALLALACGDDIEDFRPAQAGELVVATTLPAPGFWNGTPEDGFEGGVEYLIAQDLAAEFGLQLRVIDLPFHRIADADFGGADLAISQVLVTPEREQRISFSTSYFGVASGVLVRRGTTVRDLQEARDRQWVVERSTVQEPLVRDDLQPMRPALVVATREESLAALRDGRVDADLMDLPTALTIASTSAGEFEVPARFPAERQAAIALPKGSKNVGAVNVVLEKLKASGRLDELLRSELQPLLGRDPSTVPTIALPGR